MKDQKRIEILLKVIRRLHDKNPDMKKSIDPSVIDVCKGDGVTPEQVFLILLFFATVFFKMDYSRKNINKRVQDLKCFVLERNMKGLRVTGKRSGIIKKFYNFTIKKKIIQDFCGCLFLTLEF